MSRKRNPHLYRVLVIGAALILPFAWPIAALCEYSRSEPLLEIYKNAWKAFKKGGPLNE